MDPHDLADIETVSFDAKERAMKLSELPVYFAFIENSRFQTRESKHRKISSWSTN